MSKSWGEKNIDLFLFLAAIVPLSLKSARCNRSMPKTLEALYNIQSWSHFVQTNYVHSNALLHQ